MCHIKLQKKKNPLNFFVASFLILLYRCNYIDIITSDMTEEFSNLSSLALTSPCLELSYTAAATASVPQSYDPAKDN